MNILKRTLIYCLLILGSAVFLLPLAWMICTGLKPLDQTMSMPPTWIPYRYYIKSGELLQEVRKGESIEIASCVVEADGRRFLAARSGIVDGSLRVLSDDGTVKIVPVRVLQDVPADARNPWTTCTPVDAPKTEWRVVPMSTLARKISPRWENFVLAIDAMKYFPRYLANTLILCFLTVFGTVLSSALAAYGFSRVNWRGRDRTFMVALATMMIPFPVVMVPLYCMFRWLGWIGTLQPLWVGSFFAGAFNVFLLRQFFMTIPKDLSEAARIDGCSEFRIFWQIILPLSRPALMVVGLFQFMGTWNDFMGPLIYLTDQKDFTLALGLQFFQSQHGGTEWHYLMAASTIIALPIVVLFFFTQKTFIEGISMTGIKG